MKREAVKNQSGPADNVMGSIPVIKHRHYRIIRGTSVGGDAPKELARIYFFKRGQARIAKPRTWDTYIVKTGHKWYPNESIMEYILNQIGCCLGLEMAESELALVNGQIRFLSKVFRQDQWHVLEHGAELYAGFLEDREFVEEVEQRNMARDFFTLQLTYDTLKRIYPHQADDLFLSFVKMLVFDGIIGNNDRHFYNWGVLRDEKLRFQPRFAPIYDTARALFWNRKESQLSLIDRDRAARKEMIRNYVLKSKPKIGVERKNEITHIDLLKTLAEDKFPGTRDIIHSLVTNDNKERCLALFDTEKVKKLLSPVRRAFLIECLNLRFDSLLKECYD